MADLIDRGILMAKMLLRHEDYHRQGATDMALGYGSAICDVKQAPAVDVRPQWISVNDRLPTEKDQDCWVMIKGQKRPEIDWWDGRRGQTVIGIFTNGEQRKYIKSGWYYNDCNEVTHWIPIERPDPPKEVE